MPKRPILNGAQLFNMSFGFLGIQFGWGLQLANMSAVYERLGARPDQVPLLWLAAPMTGLLVQPVVGAMSDRTWGRLGRRRPYFLTGAVLASTALFFMPTSSALWMAASLLWILDASINISMEPFRAFVADKLSPSQRTAGFVMQSFFIGVGASLANALPLLFIRCHAAMSSGGCSLVVSTVQSTHRKKTSAPTWKEYFTVSGMPLAVLPVTPNVRSRNGRALARLAPMPIMSDCMTKPAVRCD